MIHNIHFLTDPDMPDNSVLIIQAERDRLLIEEHRRGNHPWGSMRPDCPLCKLRVTNKI